MKPSLGQIAYEAYSKSSRGLSLISGRELPNWEKQAEVIKKAWESAAEAVTVALLNGQKMPAGSEK